MSDKANQGPVLMADPGPARRLAKARRAAGFRTAIEAADFIGINRTTYYHHENGRRTIPINTARLYERSLSMQFGTLLFGHSLHSGVIETTAIGIIREDGRVEPMPNSIATERVMHNLAGLVHHTVVGDDLYPSYRDGDLVMHRPLDSDNLDLDRIDNEECVAMMRDGTVRLRRIIAQRNGLCTMLSPNASTAPLYDADVIAAEPVEYVDRRSRLRSANPKRALTAA